MGKCQSQFQIAGNKKDLRNLLLKAREESAKARLMLCSKKKKRNQGCVTRQNQSSADKWQRKGSGDRFYYSRLGLLAYFIYLLALDQGCQTYGPRAGCVTHWPPHAHFSEEGKSRDMSCNASMTMSLHPCFRSFPSFRSSRSIHNAISWFPPYNNSVKEDSDCRYEVKRHKLLWRLW